MKTAKKTRLRRAAFLTLNRSDEELIDRFVANRIGKAKRAVHPSKVRTVGGQKIAFRTCPYCNEEFSNDSCLTKALDEIAKLRAQLEVRNVGCSALAQLEALRGVRRGGAKSKRLIELIAACEATITKVPPSDPVDVILFFMEQNDLQQKDLVAYIGSPIKVAEVLARKRSLTKEMIRKLHKGLGIPLSTLATVRR